MKRNAAITLVPQERESGGTGEEWSHSTRDLMVKLGWSAGHGKAVINRLPFALGDATAGSETELQVAVAGRRESVDLPLLIEQSDYYANILKRAAAGDAPKRLIADLERFLANNEEQVWENSWVRFPRKTLSSYALQVFARDLLADKKNSAAGMRSDADRFTVSGPDGEELLRLPVSYLLKLALADVLGTQHSLPPTITETGRRLMSHYLNDNTSPETFSFHVVPLHVETGTGRALAREAAKRFLFTQLLLSYANEHFCLRESGQHALIYSAPHPPVRQKELNGLISDSFYRELFMSPCLSGWDEGEEKYRYMHLCHKVLSRSQLNAVAKLREAGIIVNNLVVLPTVSNVSLANNGTHISLGSRQLGRLLNERNSGFSPVQEKQLGDLTIKLTEHFLPLFVGTYSAAPYRLGYTDFHPELALGYLPHELDYTHLRMIWRRWQKKASLSIFGQPVTPFGPPWIDRMVSRLFGLKGDYVPDFRLLDYLVCLLSTPRSPALDGRLGNNDKLKKDLCDLGVFDSRMSVYLLYKLREHAKMGFSGFEGRHYSLFPSLAEDMAKATDLQLLVTALAYKLMARGELHHGDIPDDPSTESERRQIFFASAIGLPTFYVKKSTGNRFLRRILQRTRSSRTSRRYPGYQRITIDDYRLALVLFLKDEAADLIEMLGLTGSIVDLEERLRYPDERSAAGRLTKGILNGLNAKSPMNVAAGDFNQAAERYYRDELRQKHLQEAISFLGEDCMGLDRQAIECPETRKLLQSLPTGSATSFLNATSQDILRERLDTATLVHLINLLLLSIGQDTSAADKAREE